MLKVLLSPADATNTSGQVLITGSPVPIATYDELIPRIEQLPAMHGLEIRSGWGNPSVARPVRHGWAGFVRRRWAADDGRAKAPELPLAAEGGRARIDSVILTTLCRRELAE